MLSCRGGGKLSRPVYLDPHPPGLYYTLSIQNNLTKKTADFNLNYVYYGYILIFK